MKACQAAQQHYTGAAFGLPLFIWGWLKERIKREEA
jgi:hypothetical protein